MNILTGEVWVDNSTSADYYTNMSDGNTKIDWIISGGESGPNARPANIECIREIVGWCHETGTACFVKQLGAKPYEETVLDDIRYLRLKHRMCANLSWKLKRLQTPWFDGIGRNNIKPVRERSRDEESVTFGKETQEVACAG